MVELPPLKKKKLIHFVLLKNCNSPNQYEESAGILHIYDFLTSLFSLNCENNFCKYFSLYSGCFKVNECILSNCFAMAFLLFTPDIHLYVQLLSRLLVLGSFSDYLVWQTQFQWCSCFCANTPCSLNFNQNQQNGILKFFKFDEILILDFILAIWGINTIVITVYLFCCKTGAK